MGKNLKKPKLKKLKVGKFRYGGDTMGGPNDRSRSSPGPDRSAVGEGSQYQANVQAQQNKPKSSSKNLATNVSKLIDVGSMFTNPVAAVAKFGYSQFKKGKQNRMDYEGQAAGVTPMKRPPKVLAGNNPNPDDKPSLTATKLPVSNTVAPEPLFADNPTKAAVANFMVRPGVSLSSNQLGMSGQMLPKPPTGQFMIRPGVALSDVAKASNGKLIKGHPKLAKKGWK